MPIKKITILGSKLEEQIMLTTKAHQQETLYLYIQTEEGHYVDDLVWLNDRQRKHQVGRFKYYRPL